MADLKKIGRGFIEDNKTGLVVPTRYGAGKAANVFDNPDVSFVRSGGDVARLDSRGVHLKHDRDSGIAFWPAYATGFDDIVMRALVGGFMANTSRTPVAISMLSTIVAKRQAMAGTWQVVVTGRDYPTRNALSVLSMANDGQGSSAFVRDFIGALDVDNRGAFYSFVPFAQFHLDKWSDYGMRYVPIGSEDDGIGYLDVTNDDFRENRGLWAIDGLRCHPTGVPEWPFWVQVSLSPDGGRFSDGKKSRWVLINRKFGSQSIQHAGPSNSVYPGFGQSGTWRFSPYAVRHMAIDRMDWEAMINQPARGIVHASGLDYAEQFHDQIVSFSRDKREENVLLYPGVMFTGTERENSKITAVPWVEPPHGYTPSEWMNEFVSALASSFHMNETHLRLRLGEGALTQSGVAEALESETVMAWIRHEIEGVLGKAVPKSVRVTVNWMSDRQKRFQVDTFTNFSTGYGRLQRAYGDDPVLSKVEVRALIEQFFGIEIPEVSEADDIRVEGSRDGSGDDVKSGNTTQDRGQSPSDADTSASSEIDFVEAITCALDPGDRCIVCATGTPVTAVGDNGDGTVLFMFDWDAYTNASPRVCERDALMLIKRG